MSDIAEALHVDLGVGKTTTIIRCAYEKLMKMRSSGDLRVICISVSDGKLATQITSDFNELGSLTAEAWRGRGALDPSSPGETMCRLVEEASPIVGAMGSVARRLCPKCPFKATCSYLAQSERKPDVWVVAHNVLFLARPPSAITGRGIAYLVVDESPWQAGLIGTSSEGWSIPLDVLTELPLPGFLAGRLEDCRERLQRACREQPCGWVTKESLETIGFDASTGSQVGVLEGFRRISDDGSLPLKDLVDAHRLLPQMEQVWRAVHMLMNGTADATGWLEVRTTDAGARELRVFGRHTLSPTFRVPTLLADATYSERLIKPFWADVSPATRISVDTPHQSITQTVDRAFGKSSLLPRQGDKPDEFSRKERNLKRIRAMVYGLQLNAQGRVLLISNKSVIKALGILPGVETANFNAIAGRDEWNDVSDLIFLGRPLPAPRAVEDLAAALTGDPVERLTGWYRRRDVERSIAVEVIKAEEDYHPDPICNDILARIVAGELMQSIGRGRGVTRTQTNPLQVLVLTDVPLPIEIDLSTSGFSFLGEVSPIVTQLAEGGIAFESPAHASAYYPDLWPSSETAKKAFQRARGKHGGTFPYKDTHRGMSPSGSLLDEYRYQKAGERHHARTCWVDPVSLAVPRDRVERRLGTLRSFELVHAAQRVQPARPAINWVAAKRRRRQYVHPGEMLGGAPDAIVRVA